MNQIHSRASVVSEQMRELARTTMRERIMCLSPGALRVAGYHAGWLDASGEMVSNPVLGKALRPRLAILSGLAAGAKPELCAAAATAVEFVHDFTLLQDDVMDGDTERRHRPAAWTVFGPAAAILASDDLLIAAIDVLLSDGGEHGREAVGHLLSAVRALVSGQLADIGFEQRDSVTPDEYVAMAEGKTAALFRCSAVLGAVLGSASTELATQLAAYGAHLGLAFQLTDDLLGIWGESAHTGKPVLADIRRRKKSAPVVAALAANDPDSRQLAGLYASSEPFTDADVDRAAALIESCGGRTWTETMAQEHVRRAVLCLEGVDADEAVLGELAAIARGIEARRT